MEVKAPHPIAEILARKLSGIEICPPQYQKVMVIRAIKAAAKYVKTLERENKELRAQRGGVTINPLKAENVRLTSENMRLQQALYKKITMPS